MTVGRSIMRACRMSEAGESWLDEDIVSVGAGNFGQCKTSLISRKRFENGSRVRLYATRGFVCCVGIGWPELARGSESWRQWRHDSPCYSNVNLWGLIIAPSVSLPWLVYSHHSDSTFRLEPRCSYLRYNLLGRVVPSHSTVDSWPKAKRNAVRSSALALSSRRRSISPGRACGAEESKHSTGYPVRSFSPRKHVRDCIA
ncbi:hypothetical protein IWZ03DRAFT_205396 [Phyllosticta citriasiana]|uniref:Uncharacterized protein n=1 Tax=Phyllosticta citriasiana TaxID=595635 RepID=A0ABR1KKT3_9PEZI